MNIVSQAAHKMKCTIYALAFLSLSSGTQAASFDCAKASTLVEKSICSDPQLSELDSQLMQVYKKALATSQDVTGLKSDQRAWLIGVRNKCADATCLSRTYTARLEEILTIAPHATADLTVWPSVNTAALVGKGASAIIYSNPQERNRLSKLVGNNTELDDYLTTTIFSDADASTIHDTGEYLIIVSKGVIRKDTGPMDGAYAINKASGKPTAILLKDSKFTVVGATLESLPPPLKSWAAEKGAEYPSSVPVNEKKSPIEISLAKNAARVSALGFSMKWLKSTIYLQGDMVNSPTGFITLESFLSLLFDNPKISKITAIKSGKHEGVSLKVKGAESFGFLFKNDEGDLFPSHFVNGDNLVPIDTMGDKYSVSMTIMQIASASVK